MLKGLILENKVNSSTKSVDLVRFLDVLKELFSDKLLLSQWAHFGAFMDFLKKKNK